MKIRLLIFLAIVAPGLLSAQKHTISGYIEDEATGEKLLGANIFNVNTFEGTTSNNYGFYSFTQPAGETTIRYSFVGYSPREITISLIKDTLINISLQPSIELAEVVVTADRNESKVRSTQMSVNEMPIKTIKALPVFMGEVDVIKALQLMPGIQSGNEGTSGLYVRGGSPDQNLILLDGVPVYNANHLFGFFSVFNADAINSVKLVKGGFPARYGGRLSSVLDIRMKEGNSKEFHGEGSIGLIAAKLTLEGPIIKDKTSFIISARRTYADLIAKPFIAMANNYQPGYKFNAGYNFYDLNAKINHKFSDRSRLYLSAYAGRDKAYSKEKYDYAPNYDNDEFSLKWGNITTSLRWNYIFNQKLFANTRASYSKYKFRMGEVYETKSNDYTENYDYEYFSGIEDVAGSIDFDYVPNPGHYIRFGMSNIYHTFNPGVTAYSSKSTDEEEDQDIDTTFSNSRVYANETDAYIEDELTIGGRIKANAGLHFSAFAVRKKFYLSLQPRLSIRLLLNEKMSVKASYALMTQYIHLLSNTTIGLPTDLWVPSTDSITPMQSQQVAVGWVYDITGSIDVQIEGFYKWMDNLITYKPGASYFTSNDTWENMVTTGKGWSYGAEVLVRKKLGKITGWIGYTLAWSDRLFKEVSSKKYPYRYDRRHDVSVVMMWKKNENFDFGATWVFGTGNAVTLALDKYLAQADYNLYLNQDENVYYGLPYVNNIENRNNYRMPSYHRLDFNANFHKKKKWGTRTWSVGIYNAYFRQNAFFLYFDYDEKSYWNGNNPPKKVLKQVSLFPGIPYVTYSFKF